MMQAEVWDAGEGQDGRAFFGLSPERIVLSCAAALVPAVLGFGPGADSQWKESQQRCVVKDGAGQDGKLRLTIAWSGLPAP